MNDKYMEKEVLKMATARGHSVNICELPKYQDNPFKEDSNPTMINKKRVIHSRLSLAKKESESPLNDKKPFTKLSDGFTFKSPIESSMSSFRSMSKDYSCDPRQINRDYSPSGFISPSIAHIICPVI